MKLGDEIRAMMDQSASAAVKVALQAVLDMMSARGRRAGLQARNKKRGDAAFYKKIADTRWKN